VHPRLARLVRRSSSSTSGGGDGGTGSEQPSGGETTRRAAAAATSAAAAASNATTNNINQTTEQNNTTTPLPKSPLPSASRMAAPSAAGAALAAGPGAAVADASLTARPEQPAFRYWMDELLWSQGHVACETLEELLLRMGGERAGGPPKASLPRGAAAAAALPPPPPPPSEDPSSSSSSRPPTAGGPLHPLERYLGCRHVQQWDFLWSKSVYALRAARAMRPPTGGDGDGNGDGDGGATRPPGAVSAVAGLNCLTMKKRLVRALRLAYGERAWRLTPRSFELPEELPRWREWVLARRALQRALQQQQAATEAASGGADGGGAGGLAAAADNDISSSDLWILKTGQDAGKGLSLLPAERALAAAAAQAQAAAAGTSSSRAASRAPSATLPTTHAQQQAQRRLLKVAQLYVRDPLLVRGRKFHLRLWVLVTGARPLRAFLHDEGLVLFSSEPYEDLPPAVAGGADGGSAGGGGASGKAPAAGRAAAATGPSSSSSALLPPPPASHVTNFARNEGTWVWTLDDLAKELGPEAWRLLKGRIARNAAAVVAAALPSALDAHRWLGPPPTENYGFQLVGFDYLVDSKMRPWLLEVNSAPSIMAVHSDPAVARLVRSAKQAALGAMLEMVRPRFDASFASSAASAPSSSDQGRWRALADHEMQARAGFRPLAPLFASCGARVGWTPRDAELWRRMEERHGATVVGEWPEVAELGEEWEEEDGDGDDDDDDHDA
jgi:tubulin polyglutamylase TTLL6/13